MLFSATSAFATIRFVSAQGAGQYTTMESAGAAAVTGDTILVGPGTYSVPGLNLPNKRLIWIGAGWDQTIAQLNGALWYFNSAGANRTSIEGINIQQSTGNYGLVITNNVDSCTVRRCIVASGYDNFRAGGGNTGRGFTVEDCILILTANTNAPNVTISDANYPTVFRGCVFAQQNGITNSATFTGGASSGTLEIYNCVFLNSHYWLTLNTAGGPVIAVNNIFWDWFATGSVIGTYNAGSVFDYNAAPSTPAFPGTNVLTISTDPFVNYDEAVSYTGFNADLHLHATNGAALVNTGHPSLLDFTDGSRSDFGVYGGPKPLVDNGVPNYPWAVNVTAAPNLVGTGSPINATATVRVGPAY
ncbi:MAG: hypothetical protein IPP40_17480 [bacterium]|nr:hypothetical protein [bacterium]